MSSTFARYWLPVVLWIALLGWLSTTRFRSANSQRLISGAARAMPQVARRFRQETGWDRMWANHLLRKTAHVTVYTVLGFLLYRALSASLSPALSIVLTILLGGLAGAMDEVHQIFEPLRGPAVRDVGFDFSGVLLGLILGVIVYWGRTPRPARPRPLQARR